MLLLYTSIFAQQNQHCDWLILGHMPLIKFKCIPTKIQLHSCCPNAEYNGGDSQENKTDSLGIIHYLIDILYHRDRKLHQDKKYSLAGGNI